MRQCCKRGNVANVPLLTSGHSAGGEDIVVPSHLRFAAAVCVLAAALLMGGAGGAVAVAEPTGSAAPSDGGTDASGQGSTAASSPVGNATDPLRKTIQGVISTLGLGRQPGQQPSTGAKSPTTASGGTGAAVPNAVAPAPSAVPAVPNVVAPVPNVVTPVTNVVTPVTNVVTPVTNVVTPVTNVVTPVTNVVAPVTDMVATVPSPLTPVTNVVALPNLVAPVTDVITAVQDMLTSVVGAVVPQLQSSLASLFSIAGVAPVVDGLGPIQGAGRSAAAGLSVAQSPLVLPLAGMPGVPLAGNAAGVPTPWGIAAPTFGATTHEGPASSLPGMAPLAPTGAIPMGVQSFFRHAYSELVLPASLSALAAVALPGAGGLVILIAAGMRVGYRQAKAGIAVRTPGIARFAGPGPLGVVRSGSLVVVRPRASRVVPLRVVRPGALSAGCLLDKVA
jgi:hypothetical protein